MPPQHHIVGFALAAMATVTVSAQVPLLLRPIDATVEDINPLSSSLREMHSDLRQPIGFQNVYHVPGRDDLLMRVNGGIYAVFPESEYTVNRKGKTVPVIPAGTVFYIGLPGKLPTHDSNAHAGIEPTVRMSSEHEARAAAATQMGAVNTMLDMKIGDVDPNGMPVAGALQRPLVQNGRQPGAMPDSGRPSGPTIVSDSSYRARRLDELLQRAARAAGNQKS